MAILAWYRLYLLDVASRAQVHGYRQISQTKNTPKGVSCEAGGLPNNYIMDPKIQQKVTATHNRIVRVRYGMSLVLAVTCMLLFGHTAYASPLLNSIVTGNAWYIQDANGNDISAPTCSGTPSYGLYLNGSLLPAGSQPEDGFTFFSCGTPPWITPPMNSTMATLKGSALTAGDIFDYEFWTGASRTGTNVGHIEAIWDGSTFQSNNPSTATRIDTVTPYNGQTLATSSTQTIGATGYLNTADLNEKSELDIRLTQTGKAFFVGQCADVICSQASQTGALTFTYPLITASPFTYSSTTGALPYGEYTMTSYIRTGDYCLFGFCLTQKTIVSTTTTFTLATSTAQDLAYHRTMNTINILGNVSSTTDFSDCAIATLNLLSCGGDLIAYAFIPTSDAITSNVQQLHDDVLVKFPIGYVTDFVSILASSTASSTLPLIDATIPDGIAGAGSHIHLDLAHSLDFVLNATTSSFNNSSASSTQTFYEITSGYWKIIVYLGAGFYIIARIIGSHLIP